VLTGLFLGAGASVELGMPLVWDLTRKLREWLTIEKLYAFNRQAAARGDAYPEFIVQELADALSSLDMHYESILGLFEVQSIRVGPHKQLYHGMYAWLVQMVYGILYLDQLSGQAAIEAAGAYAEGLERLTGISHPLWIFSLNHDVISECLAALRAVPLHTGFNAKIILPRRDGSGRQIGELTGEVITGDEIERGRMFFAQPGTDGINLLKIHGGLDVFTFREGKDLFRLLPNEATVASIISTLRAANEELLYVIPEQGYRIVRPTNEIAYADADGKMQFLRRSLLAGAFKFDKRSQQALPYRMLDIFKSNLNYVSHLICVGYGFGDIHINTIIREWLEFSRERRLEIVAPKVPSYPSFLLHLLPQLHKVESKAMEYIAAYAS
jgi:hypothetical protein